MSETGLGVALATRGVNKRFGSLVVAADVELSLPAGVRYALIRRQRRDVLAAEQNAPGIRRQHPGYQIDQRRLAGAVGADQRIARAGRQAQLDVGGDHKRAEALVDAARGKRNPKAGLIHGFAFNRAASRESPPRIPLGSSVTTAMSNSPIQKYQYCGFNPEKRSRAIM